MIKLVLHQGERVLLPGTSSSSSPTSLVIVLDHMLDWSHNPQPGSLGSTLGPYTGAIPALHFSEMGLKLPSHPSLKTGRGGWGCEADGRPRLRARLHRSASRLRGARVTVINVTAIAGSERY